MFRCVKICVSTLLAMLVLAVPAQAEVATSYGEELRGSMMSNGIPFNPDDFTVAHRTLPFGTVITVCYIGCVDAVVTDRGPYGPADFDLSRATADAIGLTPAGIDEVGVTYH